MAKTHKDVEFHVEKPNGETDIFKDPDKAAGLAVGIAASGRKATIDVVIWSKAGARAYGGDDGVEQYNEDPEASVFERLEISVNSLGRIP
jgi:hypothetical protein